MKQHLIFDIIWYFKIYKYSRYIIKDSSVHIRTHAKQLLIIFNSKPSKLADINKEVRQTCPVSPTLFNIGLDEIVTEWKNEDKEFHYQKINNY
jgi:hypothetical protein